MFFFPICRKTLTLYEGNLQYQHIIPTLRTSYPYVLSTGVDKMSVSCGRSFVPH